MTKKIWLVLASVVLFFIAGIVFYLFYNSNNNHQQYDLNYYKNVWEQTFLNYQNTKFNIKDKGIFDFQIGFEAEGDIKNLKNMFEKSGLSFDGDFEKLSLKVFGDYDFSKESPMMNISLKIYLNKQELGVGDFDVKAKVGGEKSTYYINNLDRKLLTFFAIDQSTTDILMNMYDENKGKEMLLPLPDGTVEEIVKLVKSSSKDSPLYKNTESEEKNIIDSFLRNDVLEILSGKTENSFDKIEFLWNSNNFINFMNDVAKIINTGDSQVTFDSERELLNNLKIKGVMDLKDKLILNSTILSEILVSAIDSETNQTKYEPISIISNIKLPTPSKIDFDLSMSFFAASSSSNKIKLRIKGLIK